MINFYYSDEYLNHDTGSHPESIQRIKTVKQLLNDKYDKHHFIEPSKASIDLISKVHDKDYVEEIEDRDKYAERFNSVFEYDSQLAFLSPQYEQQLVANNTDLSDKRKIWHKNLSKDMYIAEALNVLSELQLKTSQKMVKN